jgi:hypothetical protein
VPDIHENDAHNLSTTEYAAHVGAHPRTVKTWLANEELPGAYKDPFTSEWRIPRDTVRQLKPKAKAPDAPVAGDVLPWSGGQLIPFPQAPAEPAEPTRLEDLAEEPAFLRIDEAAYYLGIPQAQILANPEVFEVMHVGVSASPRVPKRVIRKFEGA